MNDTQFFPKEIKKISDTVLGIVWNDNKVSEYPVKLLRENCPCAHCVDEWTREKKITPGSISDSVKPVHIKAVGRYAIQIFWDDGHSTGIYSFDFLRKILP